MSRYPPADYRGSRDRSRSPSRFSDRRASAASIFDNRPPGPPRNASDAPRGPRSQFDGPRPPPLGGLGASNNSRPAYSSLREAPPLGSGDRGRPYREREYDRRDRVPSPRERTPPRNFKESRDFPPRDLDVGRARRGSRDGPPSAGSTYSDGQPFSSAPFRGGYSRGRGRGDFSFRGGRGGRSALEERDAFRRDRSPPPRWGRDLSRDGREPEWRDDRRFERREDDRRSSDWTDRERDREVDRSRRDQPPPRLETRHSNESLPGTNATYQSPQAPPINPARLALIESSGADTSVRRPSVQQDPPPAREVRRDQHETPSYLNGRAETTANRYGSRDSSPPTQAPPVPAFTLSFAPPTASSTGQSASVSQAIKAAQEVKAPASPPSRLVPDDTKPTEDVKLDPPADAPTAPRVPPPAPKVQLASPPRAAPKAPRAHEADQISAPSSRLQGVRSLEQLAGPLTGATRPEAFAPPARPSSTSMSPAAIPALPTLIQPVSPSASRFGDLAAPTGPRATRMSPAQASVSPRPPFASPRSDIGGFQSSTGMPRVQTPPPSAPSGPRNRSYSVSPKVTTSNIPTAPKGIRGTPNAPRGLERGPQPLARVPDRLGAPPPWAPPVAPRSLQWRRPVAPGYGEKIIPVKRDVYGEEKAKPGRPFPTTEPLQVAPASRIAPQISDCMEVDKPIPKRQSSLVSGPSAAQSFFGKSNNEDLEEEDEDEDEDTGMSDAEREPLSTSDDDESDLEGDLTLFNAKFERQKRQLEAQMADLSTRHYRATTPLESIARLARISVKDLERLNEQREHEMDVDSPATTNQRPLPPTVHSSDSGEGPDLLTPKGEDEACIAIRGSDDSSESIRRIRRPSPEPIALPYLLKDAHVSLHESEAFKENYNRHEDSQADILDAMEEDLAEDEDADEYNLAAFAAQYRRWREECEDLDRLKEEQEKLERQLSLEPGPEPDVPAAQPINPILEGRRLHKFSSEYEIEQVLKQSEETARIEQERQDREAKKNQADMEKEARIPDMQTEDEIRRCTFIDSNRFREPELLTTVFSYEPPEDTFTDEEQHIFVAAFKETPKKWGEIASLLPNRTYEDCIRHYYANKWDGRFRDNRTKKLKAGGRRGRGGRTGPRGRMGGLMADLARTEELFSPDVSEKGRPRRAAAPTTFGEKEAEAKANLLGPSPAKKPGPAAKADANGEVGLEKPGKRQKRTGEKLGRKAKANQPLAALAAAPQASPTKFIHSMHNKEDLARVKQFEDASLLPILQAGHPGIMKADGPMVYSQDGVMQHMPPPPEDPERSKAMGQAPSAKPSASSYWSVPEQSDFTKYIGHFGRDFGAIATHMGTKTQTMIKNHYQRQIDGGNKPELEQAANEADERRTRGDDIGPPPTPTPIVKRKYDAPAPPAQRPLAPHTEMDIDDSSPPQRGQALKHASPHQYQAQPRFTTSAQNTPIPAPRVAPSPLPVSAIPAPGASQLPATTRSQQLSLKNQFTFLPESRSESRQTGAAPSFHPPQDTPPRTQSSQTNRPVPDHFIRSLYEQQNQAKRMEEQHHQQERIEQIQRQSSLHRNLSQGSPLSQHLHNPPDRKPIIDERPPSPPPRTPFPTSTLGRLPYGITSLGSLVQPPFSSLSSRPALNLSPPKREEPRPTSINTAPPVPPPAASAPPSEPKRSNVLSLLNSEPEEPKPPKRESLPSVPQRTTSPATQTYPHTSSATPLSSVSASRREPSFGQPSMPQSQFQHGPFGQQSSNVGPAPPSLKHEPPSIGSMSQPTKDWAVRVFEQNAQQQSPSTPTFERNVRPYFQHSDSRPSILASLGQARANPSPPSHQGIPHSRTPSLTAQQREPPRAPSRSGLGSQQPALPLQPNPYASQQTLSFSQQPGAQGQNHAHHSHTNSLSNPFPSLHHRATSREEHARHEYTLAAQREREEQDVRWRQRQENLEAERRQHEGYLAQQRQQQQDRQQTYNRGPPQPLQPPVLGGSSFSQSRGMDLREQSRMETTYALRQDADRRRQEALMRDREEAEVFGRRQEDSSFPGRTPLGGGFFPSRR